MEQKNTKQMKMSAVDFVGPHSNWISAQTRILDNIVDVYEFVSFLGERNDTALIGLSAFKLNVRKMFLLHRTLLFCKVFYMMCL